MIPRFTLDGGPALEARLDRACAAVLRGLQAAVPGPRLEAVLLGGGYGRGEGGVLRDGAGEAPYNDLEFYVCLRGNRWRNERRWGRALPELAHQLTPEAGIEVELKLFSLSQLRRAPVSMFYYDLVLGHRWVLGEERLLRGCEHLRHAERIPLAEATRLLMNRGVNAVVVGYVETEATDATYGDAAAQAAIAANIGAGRLARAGEIADAVLFLASPLASYVTGAALNVDGGGERPPFLDIVKEHTHG